jgi:hypothetical protein
MVVTVDLEEFVSDIMRDAARDRTRLGKMGA